MSAQKIIAVHSYGKEPTCDVELFGGMNGQGPISGGARISCTSPKFCICIPRGGSMPGGGFSYVCSTSFSWALVPRSTEGQALKSAALVRENEAYFHFKMINFAISLRVLSIWSPEWLLSKASKEWYLFLNFYCHTKAKNVIVCPPPPVSWHSCQSSGVVVIEKCGRPPAVFVC